MVDSYTFLKNMDILDDKGDLRVVQDGEQPSCDHPEIYQEDISSEIAKKILGERFAGIAGTKWQLWFERDVITLLEWRPGESEPITYELEESSEEVMSYSELQETVADPTRFLHYNTEALEDIEKPKTDWFKVSLATLGSMFMIGIALLIVMLMKVYGG